MATRKIHFLPQYIGQGPGALYMASTGAVLSIGALPVSLGGSGVSMAATGGAGHLVRQATVGGNFTTAPIGTSDLGSGTANSTKVLRGDLTWSDTVTGDWTAVSSIYGSGGTAGTTDRQVIGTSAGLLYVTPTSTAHVWKIAGTTALQISAQTGGTGHFLRQTSAGGALTSAAIGTADLGSSGTAGTDTVLRGDLSWNNAVTGAWSIGTALNFTSISTVTAANRQWVATSSGLVGNTPTGTDIRLGVNGTSIYQFTSTAGGLLFAADTSAATSGLTSYGRVSGNLWAHVPSTKHHGWYVNAASVATLDNTSLTLAATNGLIISSNGGAAAGGNPRQIYGTSGGLTIESVGTLSLNISGTNHAQLTTSGLVFATARTGTPNACSICKEDVSNNMRFNVAFNGEYYFGHNGTTTFLTMNHNYLNLSSTMAINFGSGGTVTGANRQIIGTSTGINYNVPASLSHRWLVNNALIAYTGDAGLFLASGMLLGAPGVLRVDSTWTDYAVSSTTSVLNLTNKGGWIEFQDFNGGYARIRYSGATGSLTIEASSAKWVASASPASDEVGLAVASGTTITMYVGSAVASAARKISWQIRNHNFA